MGSVGDRADEPLSARFAYFATACVLWFVVDFGTAGGFRSDYLLYYGAVLPLFYIGYPLVFTWLIFWKQASNGRLVWATIAAVLFIEIVFSQNTLLTTFPILLLGIPLAILVYLPLTFFPLWIARREMRRHLPAVVGLAAVELVVMALTTFGKG